MAEHLTFCIYHLPTLAQFVFIRDAPSAAAEHELKSLSIPIDHLAASKYTIPIFSAPYLQADVYSVAQGGLPERQPGEEAHPVGKLKLWFVEAGGVAFRDAIEKARHMWQQNRQQQLDQDALRMCLMVHDWAMWASQADPLRSSFHILQPPTSHRQAEPSEANRVPFWKESSAGAAEGLLSMREGSGVARSGEGQGSPIRTRSYSRRQPFAPPTPSSHSKNAGPLQGVEKDRAILRVACRSPLRPRSLSMAVQLHQLDALRCSIARRLCTCSSSRT